MKYPVSFLVLLLTTNEGSTFLQYIWDAPKRDISYRKAIDDNYSLPPTNATKRVLSLKLPHIIPTTDYPHETHERPPWIDLRPLFQLYFTILGGTSEDRFLRKEANKYRKFQDIVPDSVPFPCNVSGFRSAERPTSADKVRPGDIDVVGAIGDSLSVGNGVAATDIPHLVIGNRGLSFTGGGQGNWRQYTTLPNILKEFNPNLKGYATGDSFYGNRRNEGFNVAVPAAIIDDVPLMAETFVYRVKRDPKVNFEKDWKLVSLMIGSVDICADICYWERPANAPYYHKLKLEKTLDYLKANSPRTIVNIVVNADVPSLLANATGLGFVCRMTNTFLCPCVSQGFSKHKRQETTNILHQILDIQEHLGLDPKYQDKEDFAVISQPLLRNVRWPTVVTPQGRVSDYRFFAPDCFHMSQRGQAIVGNGLWNSMLTPVGQKESLVDPQLFHHFYCPTNDNPYIFTKRNSVNATKLLDRGFNF